MNKTTQKVLAIIGIALLVGLYLTTLITALIGSSAAIELFKVSVVGTITIPILLWIFISIFKRVRSDVEEAHADSDEISASTFETNTEDAKNEV